MQFKQELRIDERELRIVIILIEDMSRPLSVEKTPWVSYAKDRVSRMRLSIGDCRQGDWFGVVGAACRRC